MGTNQDYKNRALQNLEGNWGSAAIVALVYMLLLGGVSDGFSFVMEPEISMGFSVLWVLICLPIAWAFSVMFLDLIRGYGKPEVGKLFDGFRNGQWGRIFTTYLLVEIYTFLWALLFVIPGIIKALSYSMTCFILKDNPELSNNAAIEKSMRMMDGHKMELFWLYLSFIGWAILSLFTLGIGFIFLEPYVQTTLAHFYEDLKAEQGE